MSKYLPYVFAGLGVFMIIFSMVLRNGMPDAHVVITNLTSSFMLIAGGICLVVGLVTFFLRHDDEVW